MRYGTYHFNIAEAHARMGLRGVAQRFLQKRPYNPNGAILEQKTRSKRAHGVEERCAAVRGGAPSCYMRSFLGDTPPPWCVLYAQLAAISSDKAIYTLSCAVTACCPQSCLPTVVIARTPTVTMLAVAVAVITRIFVQPHKRPLTPAERADAQVPLAPPPTEAQLQRLRRLNYRGPWPSTKRQAAQCIRKASMHGLFVRADAPRRPEDTP